MQEKSFSTLVVSRTNQNTFIRQIREKSTADLPDGDVLIRVQYSALNYKDALSATGHRGVTRSYPHTPGIDAAGLVEHSHSSAHSPGDPVLVTGYDLGMNTPGGFGQYIRVPAGWVVKLPETLGLRESMIFGTAGFTAALSLLKLQRYGVPAGRGDILITGATGGVGSLAVAILSRAGYRVVAATGKPDRAAYLQNLGAAEIIPREEITDTSGKPLLHARWAGAIDTAGGTILSTALRSTVHGGAVASCGLVASPDLPLTVYPFILRGVGLLGIDSAECPMETRLQIWDRLAADWKPENLDTIATERPLTALNPEIDRILRGGQAGRILVNLEGGDQDPPPGP